MSCWQAGTNTVPGECAHDEGTRGAGSIHDEAQGGCPDSVWIGGCILSTSSQTETSSMSALNASFKGTKRRTQHQTRCNECSKKGSKATAKHNGKRKDWHHMPAVAQTMSVSNTEQVHGDIANIFLKLPRFQCVDEDF